MRTETDIEAELQSATPIHGSSDTYYQAYSGSQIVRYVLLWVLGDRATPPSKADHEWK